MRKILIAVVVVLVVLPATAALLVPVLLTPEMLKVAIERQGSQWLGRAVTVGSARAQLFPRTGITLTQVTVDGVPRLTADDVVVGASLRGLISKRIVGAVVRVRNGRLGLADASTSGQRRHRPRASPRPGEMARVGRLRRRPPPGAAPRRRIRQASRSIRSARSSSTTSSSVAAGSSCGWIWKGALAGDTFEVARLAASSGATSLQGSGSVTSISRRDGTFSLESPLVDVDEVLAVLAALVPADPSATGMSALAGEQPDGLTFGHVTGHIKVDRGQALGYDVSKLDGAIDIKGTVLTARPLAFDLYGGRYESTLELDLATNRIALVHDAVAQRDQRRQARRAVRQRRRGHWSAWG